MAERQNCCYKGCTKQGLFGLRVKMYALGCEHIKQNSLQMYVPMPLCREHADGADADELFADPAFRDGVNNAIGGAGKRLPDWDTLKLETVPMNLILEARKQHDVRAKLNDN